METFAATRDVLLRRLGLVVVEPGAAALGERELRAVDLELAAVGYMPTSRLRARLATLPADELGRRLRALTAALAAHVGGGQRHEPLFRKFPEDVPQDTFELYVRKVLVHYLQADCQPCLFCRRTGTTHVLQPCLHVVCDHCFDGSNYSACPVCEHHVDRSSPFFKPTGFLRFQLPKEKITFKLLDLCDDLEAQAQALLRSFCERKQAMSPVDVADLGVLLGDFGDRVLPWLPARIAVRENVAHVFGALLKQCAPAATLAVARPHLVTATDVLRVIAAYSGADPSLQGQMQRRTVKLPAPDAAPDTLFGKLKAILGAGAQPAREVSIRLKVHRFKVARLGRPLRRALVAHLESLRPDALIEDMLRHRSYWVWIGEHLHPHEYAKTCPNVARAFAVVRKKAPDGTPAPKFVGYYGALEAAARAGDAATMVSLLQTRPGELARRFDHVLRVAGDDQAARRLALAGFSAAAPKFSNPVLLTLRGLLPARARPLPVRVFWPKGQVVKGVSAPDTRAPLAPEVIDEAGRAVEHELLRRFADKPRFDRCVIDDALRGIVVPFNERTASKAAVALPRGSRVALPAGKVVRLFLHWCQPERGGRTTDIDLSIGFYDAAWQHVAVCSYYSLRLDDDKGRPIARSSGDLRSAPFPDGASEFVDLHRQHALDRGLRYAVMVVNNYAGMSFDQLERGFAGMMLREDLGGAHFDPRTVELKFDLQGKNGVFMPLVLDIAEAQIHWLDVYSKGALAFNNVQSSNDAITKICPEMIAYFASGTRISVYDLALLHAAARGREVLLRGATTRRFTRRDGETPEQFLRRLQAGDGAEPGQPPGPDGPPVFAALFKGDLDLPAGSVCYALFRERVTGPIAASDLLS
jgi:hypothetical protein